MTDQQRLAEIALRAEKASIGPWDAEETGDHKYTVITSPGDVIWEPVAEIPHDDVTEEGWNEAKANVAFIVGARLDVPFLLAAVAERDEAIKEHCKEWCAYGLRSHGDELPCTQTTCPFYSMSPAALASTEGEGR